MELERTSNSPTISVIVPVYNSENGLSGMLDSLIHQTYHDYEVIIVDDGSTDRSVRICDDYASRYSFITVMHKANGGVSAARNYGLKIARGVYVTFADSDDYVSPYWLEVMVKDIDGCDQLICDFRQGSRDRFSITDIRKDNGGGHNVIVSRSEEDFRRNIIDIDKWCFGAVWRQLFRRSIIVDNRIEFPNSQMEDLIFSYTFFTFAESVAKSSYDGYYYIHNCGSLSRSHQAIVEYDWLQRMEELHDGFIRKHHLEDHKEYKAILAQRFSVIATSYILKGYYSDTRMAHSNRMIRWRQIKADRYFRSLKIGSIKDKRVKLMMLICRYGLYSVFDSLLLMASSVVS